MLTERKLSEKLMTRIRDECRGSLVIKHADRTTRGIPDLSASWREDTFWIENKYLRKGRRVKDVIKFDQLMFCHELSNTTGKCWITVFEDDPQQTTVWLPRALVAYTYPSVLFAKLPIFVWEQEDENMIPALLNYGAIMLPGVHYYGIGARLILDYQRMRHVRKDL